MPILFWFHGAGVAAGVPEQLVEVAHSHGFAVVAGEARRCWALRLGHGAYWNIPEVVTNLSGNKCRESDSWDIAYIKAAVAKLGESPWVFDTSRLFFAGCSMGAAFSIYISICLKKQPTPFRVSAFAPVAAGLKEKGDGMQYPPSPWGNYMVGECPSCQYAPALPEQFVDKLGLKACIFANEDDGTFFEAAQALDVAWGGLQNSRESYFCPSGGHCKVHSYEALVHCLDDGTGRLLSNGARANQTDACAVSASSAWHRSHLPASLHIAAIHWVALASSNNFW